MSSIDKDIERCKELIKEEHSNWIGLTNQEALENVLLELEIKETNIRFSNKVIEDLSIDMDYLKSELATYKKIAERLAEQLQEISDYTYDYEYDEYVGEEKYYCEAIYGHCKNTEEPFYRGEKCKKCLIDWARKEVEK